MSVVKGDLKTYRAAVRSREVAQKRALIGQVFQRPAIWNRNVEEHKSRCYVDSMWDEVATQTGWDREFCKKTWKHLVDHFRNIYCHTMFRKNDGKEPNPPLSVKWTYFKNMLFMKDCVQKRLAFPNTSASDAEVFINADTSAIEPQCSWPDAQNVTEFVVEDVRDIGEGDMNASTTHAVVEINDVAMPSRTPPAGPISSSSSPSSNKRRRINVLAHAVDSCTDNNNTAFHNQSSKTISAVTMQNQVKTEDTEDKFCQFLGDILREVSPKLRRACRSMLLEVCNSFADGKIPSLIQPDQNSNEI